MGDMIDCAVAEVSRMLKVLLPMKTMCTHCLLLTKLLTTHYSLYYSLHYRLHYSLLTAYFSLLTTDYLLLTSRCYP